MPESMNWSLAWPYMAMALALGYLLGSLPWGLMLTRWAGLGDIRSIGSGNIGATNVLRTGSKKLAAATLLLDAAKGTVAVFIGWYWGPNTALLAALGAFLGHVFPVWLGFKGGKGVATFIGCLVAISWKAALAFGAIWLAVAAASRYSSLAAILATLATPAVLWSLGERQAAEMFALMAVILIVKHHQNIARLFAGKESRIGARE